MSCFCHATTAQLLAKLQATASLAVPGLPLPHTLSGAAHHRLTLPTGALGSPAALLAAELAGELAHWLSARALPAEPWHPDPAWLTLQLPTVHLSAQTVATISALAHMRAQVLAEFGLDLLLPAQVLPFARIIATLNARLTVLAEAHLSAAAAPQRLLWPHWQKLAALDRMIEQVARALLGGLLPVAPAMLPRLTLPGGIPMARWSGFLVNLQLLAPLIAAAIQLETHLTETAQFSASLRVLSRLQLPALAHPEFTAMLGATLGATAHLSASLKVDVLALGVVAIERLIAEKLAQLMRDIARATGVRTLGPEAALAWPRLKALLPDLPVVPSGFAVPALVTAALRAHAVASLNWRVTATLPAVSVALQAASLIAQVTVLLGTSPLRATPCAQGCDAARLTRALAPAATG